jgi:hypothetical protein
MCACATSALEDLPCSQIGELPQLLVADRPKNPIGTVSSLQIRAEAHRRRCDGKRKRDDPAITAWSRNTLK